MKRAAGPTASAALLLSIALPGFAWAYDFKGISVGQTITPSELRKQFGARCTANKAGGQDCTANNSIAEVGAFLNVTLHSSGVVQRIALQFESAKFSVVESALRGKFGEPTSTDRSEVQTRAGVTYQQIEHTWRQEGSEDIVRAIRYGSNVTRSFVFFSGALDRDEFEQQRQQRAKDL